MIVGAIGVIMSLIWMLTANRRNTTVVERTDRRCELGDMG